MSLLFFYLPWIITNHLVLAWYCYVPATSCTAIKFYFCNLYFRRFTRVLLRLSLRLKIFVKKIHFNTIIILLPKSQFLRVFWVFFLFHFKLYLIMPRTIYWLWSLVRKNNDGIMIGNSCTGILTKHWKFYHIGKRLFPSWFSL